MVLPSFLIKILGKFVQGSMSHDRPSDKQTNRDYNFINRKKVSHTLKLYSNSSIFERGMYNFVKPNIRHERDKIDLTNFGRDKI